MSVYSRRLVRLLALFVLATLFLSLVRLESVIWNHAKLANQSVASILTAFWQGLRFDLAASAWTLAPLLLILGLPPWPARWEKGWTRLAWALFVLIHVPFLALNLIDVESVNFVGRRMTADVLFMIGEAQGKLQGFLSAFLVLMVVGAVTMLLMAWASWRVIGWRPERPPWLPPGRVARGVFAFLLFLGAVLASRGGVQSKPISFVDANVFEAPSLNNLVLNTTFNILKNLNQENLPRAKYFAERLEMDAYLNGTTPARSLLEGRRPSRPQNVVVIMLESFGLEYTGGGWTPFLDQLARESLSFRNAFANGRRSIEGVAAVMGGVPALMSEPFVTSPFTANHFVGLGTLLTPHAYESAFFHGGNNGTMHFDSFMRSAGVENYFGAREYPNPADNDGVWGIYDRPFFRWMLGKIGAMRKPFLASAFSLSSHHPYLIPADERDRYPEGPHPILKTIAYTDSALREFFETASKEPWFHDTLFVITADHALQAIDAAKDDDLDRYRIPLIFYREGFRWPDVDRDAIVQQIDILPSIADFLGLSEPAGLALARSIFVPGERTATLYLDGGRYLEVGKDFFLSRERDGRVKMYALTDAQEKTALDEPASRKTELENRLKAAIQFFSEGMWDNRLYR